MANIKNIECKFVGYTLKNKSFLTKAISKIKPEYLCFYKDIYQAECDFYDNYKGVMTPEYLKKQISLKSSDEKVILETSISEIKGIKVSSEADFDFFMDTIIENYKKRELVFLASIIINNKEKLEQGGGVEEISLKVDKILKKVTSSGVDSLAEGEIKESAKERFEQYKYRKSHPDELKMVKTGFKQIDEAMIGWGFGTTTFVAGRQGDGKSTLLLNLAYHIWKQGYNVILYSLEVDKAQYERRWDARAALVSSKGLKEGTLDEREEKIYQEYLENLEKGKDFFGNKVGSLYIVDCTVAVTPAYIEQKTEEVEREKGIVYDCVIIDYLGIMTPNNPTGVKRDDLGTMSLNLKQYARTSNKILLSAVQMNRAGKKDSEGKNGKTDTTAVADSDQILNHADNAIVIRSISDTDGIMESIKVRDGSPFRFHIEKDYNKMNIIEVMESEWEKI